MKIDFKKELETASKGMIMIHDPNLLIKLIVRMLVRKLGVRHAGMILFDAPTNAYILKISRGKTGFKIPQGFTRFNDHSPIIKLFKQKEYRSLTVKRSAIVSTDINQLIWRESVLDHRRAQQSKDLLYKVNEQMELFNAAACVPAYYREGLMAILLLGEKKDGRKFHQEELDFFSALASDAAMAIRNAQLFESLRQEAERNHHQFLKTILVLGSTIEAKDAYTHGHTERVTKYGVAIAHELADSGVLNFSEDFFENLYIAGLLHDIGKIAVPESILNKNGRLTPEEYAVMKTHPDRGAEMVKPLNIPRECIDGIQFHHERYDGKGYPQGLQGENIPIVASILAVGDAFDAMTSDRPYRIGLDREVAMQEILNNVGKQFNPIPVKAFEALYKKGQI